MYAIIESGGKQYRVSEGDVIRVEKLDAQQGGEVRFDRVLSVVTGEKSEIGTPLVEGAEVRGKVVSHGKARKIIVYKYKPKKNYRRKRGHRQPFTEVRIEKIEMPG